MSRPRKQTVDYFPHSSNHKKTMFILEQRWGNDGYAFWFKLLETLAGTEGHFIDLNDDANWAYLQAKTRLDEVICKEILDLLSKIDAIDKELWENKVVWSQNFVDGIADVYRNRKVDMPVRPSFYCKKSHEPPQSNVRNPQSKVKESKVNKSIYGEFKNVFLSEKEYQSLLERHGEKETIRLIELLSRGIESKGYKYKSHYATILNWKQREVKDATDQRRPGKTPEEYSKPEDHYIDF
jgi:hypothetical protein